MNSFTDDDFRDLPPRERRYEIQVADDLFFAVFPNGVKIWVLVYRFDGIVRRQTLGAFPEMTLAQALREADKDPGSESGPPPPRAARRLTRRAGIAAGVAVGIALISLAAYRIISTGSSTDGAQTPENRAGASATARPGGETAPSSVREPEPEPEPEQSPDGRSAAGVSEAVSREIRQPEATREPGNRAEEAPPLEPPEARRALLALDVVDREPVGPVSDVLSAFPDIQRVYFYTDVRNAGGSEIVHRWLLDGALMAERRFSVGSNYRWRVFSAKDLEPGQLGWWRVELRDGDDRLLAEQSFEYAEDTPRLTVNDGAVESPGSSSR